MQTKSLAQFKKTELSLTGHRLKALLGKKSNVRRATWNQCTHATCTLCTSEYISDENRTYATNFKVQDT